MILRRALLPLFLLVACAAWNQPVNAPLSGGSNVTLVEEAAAPRDGEVRIGLAVSGGGMRASVFASGMTEELRAAGSGGANGLPDHARLVSGVPGGSVTAAQPGLNGPGGLQGYRERDLVTGAGKYMSNSAPNPLTIVRGLSGGGRRIAPSN